MLTPKWSASFQAFSKLGRLELPFRDSLDKVAEFCALHAFQLGLRTGKGLADSFTA